MVFTFSEVFNVAVLISSRTVLITQLNYIAATKQKTVPMVIPFGTDYPSYINDHKYRRRHTVERT